MSIFSRRGVTMIELLIAMVIAAVLGAATLSLMMSQGRFAERAEGQRAGRRVGRSAINALSNDLRMVDPDWGVEAASATSITVKVPYALGIVCASTTSLQTVALLPVDSVALNLPGYSGYASRNSGGVYSTYSGGTVTEIAFPAACTTANVVPITAPASAPNQKTRVVTMVTTGATVLTAGTPVMLYRRTQFYFGNSNQTGGSNMKALFSVPGGRLAYLLRDSPTFAPIINAGLAAGGVIAGTPTYNQFFTLVQNVTDSADPAYMTFPISAVAPSRLAGRVTVHARRGARHDPRGQPGSPIRNAGHSGRTPAAAIERGQFATGIVR